MKKWLLFSLAVLMCVGCSGKANPVKTQDPTEQVKTEKKLEKPVYNQKDLGVRLWRLTCYHMNRPSLLKKGTPEDIEVPVGEGGVPEVEACVEGFMSLPRNAPDLAARCVLNAASQEDMNGCVEQAVIDAKLEQ